MHKDPFERELQFRQSLLGRDAVTKRRARRRSSRPWLGCLLMLVMFLAFGGLFLFIFGLHIKWTDAYACSLAQARRSPTVIAELGEPIEASFFALTSSYSQGGGGTTASFRTWLRGPKGEGTLFVNWYTSPIGSSLRMELLKEGKTYPVYGGTAQCP